MNSVLLVVSIEPNDKLKCVGHKPLMLNLKQTPDAESEQLLTLKAFANFSPGLALKPWVKKAARDFSQL